MSAYDYLDKKIEEQSYPTREITETVVLLQVEENRPTHNFQLLSQVFVILFHQLFVHNCSSTMGKHTSQMVYRFASSDLA